MPQKAKVDLVVPLEKYEQLLDLASMFLDACLQLGLNFKKYQRSISDAKLYVASLKVPQGSGPEDGVTSS